MKASLLHSFSCKVVDCLANLKVPSLLLVPLIRAYAKFYRANLNEASKPLHEYGSFNDFFTRELKPGTREIKGSIVCPIDGTLVDKGPAARDTTIKGRTLDISSLLSNEDLYLKVKGGIYLNYYLAPGDYHRIHSPITGEVVSITKIDGTLYSVKPDPTKESVLPINKRIVVELKTSKGAVLVVLIGALNVGRIELSPNVRVGNALNAGEHLGTFYLGSSVVVIFPSNVKVKDVSVPKRVFVGEEIAS